MLVRKLVFIVACILSAIAVVVGISILSFYSMPFQKSEVVRNMSLSINPGGQQVKEFGCYSGSDNVVSYNVLNGSIKLCEPLNETFYQEWLSGHYVPNWIQSNSGTYEYKGVNLPPGLIGTIIIRYFLFFNDSPQEQTVQVLITAYWTEPNVMNQTISTLFIVFGSIGLSLSSVILVWLSRSHQPPKYGSQIG